MTHSYVWGTWRDSLQRTATHCNTLQHTITHCSTLQHTHSYVWGTWHDSLQHTATHCNTLIHMCEVRGVTHCNTLQHTATHCNTLQHTATHSFICVRYVAWLVYARSVLVACKLELLGGSLWHNSLLRTWLIDMCEVCDVTHCNTLQHTATHSFICVRYVTWLIYMWSLLVVHKLAAARVAHSSYQEFQVFLENSICRFLDSAVTKYPELKSLV